MVKGCEKEALSVKSLLLSRAMAFCAVSDWWKLLFFNLSMVANRTVIFHEFRIFS